MKGRLLGSTTAKLSFLCILAAFAWTAGAQNAPSVRERYTKYEYLVPMRDGTRLFTEIYVPKDSSQSYPFLLTRTPYNVAPYGSDNYRTALGPSEQFEKEGFIFVYQDARGRYLSEGDFLQVRPYIPDKRGPKDVDESTDTYDTVDWLVKNVPNNNGRAGMIGISQPGFHVAASMIHSHPALKCASPQAPTADYYMGDDVYHNGAFMLAANFSFYSSFRPRSDGPEKPSPQLRYDPGTPDGYDFYLHLPPLAAINDLLFHGQARFWQEIVDHPNYDGFWKPRSLWKYMDEVNCAVLNVGGWFDAEDPMGPLHIYRSVEQKNPDTPNMLVMGPWSHGGWARGDGDRLGNINFGVKTAAFFRDQIQFPFFMHYLKDKKTDLPEAYMFLTGIDEWRRHGSWPPRDAREMQLFLGPAGSLVTEAPSGGADNYDEYISDPDRPVPYLGYITQGMTSDYMTEDQRFASQRTDVLVYRTDPLDRDLTIAGPIRVDLHVSTTGTDSDYVVKLIDVYPPDYPTPPVPEGTRPAPNSVKMGGYQQLVRGEPFRAKFRNGFETPEPMTPGKPDVIRYALPDVYHTFRRGHRIMIQIQSSWFPLVDRNPQTFVDIPKARPEDFRKATERIYRSTEKPSSIIVLVEGAPLRTAGSRDGGTEK